MACLALSVLCAQGAAVAANATPSLHVLHEMRDRLKLEGQNKHLQFICRQTVLHEDPEAAARNVTPLPAAANTMYYREESFFDGQREAHYVTSQTVRMSADCKPMLERSFTVKISNGCIEHLSGSNGIVGSDGKSGSTPHVDKQAPLEPGDKGTCPRGEKSDASQWLAMAQELPADTINGQQCVWQQDMMLKVVGKAPPARPLDKRTLDQCLWRQQPWYAGMKGRPVVIAAGSAHTGAPAAQRARDAAEAGYESATPVSTPVLVESGVAISSDRFSLDAANSFVKQPALVPATAVNLEMK